MTEPRTIQINIRLSPVKFGRLNSVAHDKGHRGVAAYLRTLAVADVARHERKKRREDAKQ